MCRARDVCESNNIMKPKSRKNSTSTSSFGSPGRIGHDSTKFYSSKLYKGQTVPRDVTHIENPIDASVLDKVYCKSSEAMEEIPDYSVHLMVTSLPYNVTKEYDEDLSLDEYRDLLKRVFREIYRVLVTGGRACCEHSEPGSKALHSPS